MFLLILMGCITKKYCSQTPADIRAGITDHRTFKFQKGVIT